MTGQPCNIKVIASSSKGNCYLVNLGSKTFLLDCGIDLKRITKNVNVSQLDFAFISHNHKDHSKCRKELITRGVKVIEGKDINKFTKIELDKELTLFLFDVKHGDEPNAGIIIINNITREKILYITDFTICKYDLKQIKFTHVLLECNYVEQMLNIDTDSTYRERRQIDTHMGLEGLQIFMDSLSLEKCQRIYLCHMSLRYGMKELMQSVIYNKYKIKTGVCLSEGGVDFIG